MINEENCKGCKSYELIDNGDIRVCSECDILDNKECPCINCLVKVMCTNFCSHYLKAIRLKGSKGVYRSKKIRVGESIE